MFVFEEKKAFSNELRTSPNSVHLERFNGMVLAIDLIDETLEWKSWTLSEFVYLR